MHSTIQISQNRTARRIKLEVFFKTTTFYGSLILPYEIINIIINNIQEEEDWLVIHKLYRITQSLNYQDLILRLWRGLSHFYPCCKVKDVLDEIETCYLLTPAKQVEYYEYIRNLVPPTEDPERYFFGRRFIDKLFNVRRKNKMYWFRNHQKFETINKESNLERYQDYRDRFITILKNDLDKVSCWFHMGKELIDIKKAQHFNIRNNCMYKKGEKLFGEEELDLLKKLLENKKVTRESKSD